MDDIAVLIPCYNEAQTIRKVVTDWKKELPEAVIYVYDNNSNDDTAVIAEEAGDRKARVYAGERQCDPKNVSGDRCKSIYYGGW